MLINRLRFNYGSSNISSCSLIASLYDFTLSHLYAKEFVLILLNSLSILGGLNTWLLPFDFTANHWRIDCIVLCESSLGSHWLNAHCTIGHKNNINLRILLLVIHLVHLLESLHPWSIFAISSLGRVAFLFIIIFDCRLVLTPFYLQRFLIHIQVEIYNICFSSLGWVIIISSIMVLWSSRSLFVIVRSGLISRSLKRCALSCIFTGLRKIVYGTIVSLAAKKLVRTSMSCLGCSGHCFHASIRSRRLDTHSLACLLGDSPLLVNLVTIHVSFCIILRLNSV